MPTTTSALRSVSCLAVSDRRCALTALSFTTYRQGARNVSLDLNVDDVTIQSSRDEPADGIVRLAIEAGPTEFRSLRGAKAGRPRSMTTGEGHEFRPVCFRSSLMHSSLA